jgi:hypothetical protein
VGPEQKRIRDLAIRESVRHDGLVKTVQLVAARLPERLIRQSLVDHGLSVGPGRHIRLSRDEGAEE